MLGPSSDQPKDSCSTRLSSTTIQEQPASVEQQEKLATESAGTINIEFPGRALVSAEGSPDPAVVRAILNKAVTGTVVEREANLQL